LKIVRVVRIAFTAVGFAMLAGALALALTTRAFLQEATQAPGTVVELLPVRSDGSTTWKPVVRFMTSDGREVRITSSAASQPPAYAVGESVTVFYRLEAPEKGRISGFLSLWGGAFFLGVLGSVFFVVGVVLFLASAVGARRAEALRRRGRRIEADFSGVEVNTARSINGRHPWQIVSQWLDPTPYVQGRRLTVFIDPTNPRRHLVDVGFLPRLAE